MASGDDGGPGSPTPAADGGQSTATGTGLHTVMGNGAIGTIVDKDGKVVHLRGVSMEGPQYMCDMNAAVFDPICLRRRPASRP